MARRLFCKAALAAFVSLVAIGLTRADGPCPPPQPVVIQILTQQPNQATVVSAPANVVVNGDDATTPRRNHPVRDKLENAPHPVLNALENHPPVGCWAHHNAFGCGSLKSETTFIFGSCRTFFGQSCMKEPPPGPLAPVGEGYQDEPKPARSRLFFNFCPNCR